MIAQGYEGEAAARLQGAQNVSSNIMSAASSVAGGVGAGVSKAQLTQAEIGQLNGKVQAMHGSGVISDDDVAKFNSASLAQKRGMVGEWDAHANILSQEQMDTFKTNNDMRRDSNLANVNGANAATVAQLKSGIEPPKYDRVTLADGTVAFVAPNGPTTYPTDATGRPLKAQQPAANPLTALLGATPAAAAEPPSPVASATGRPAVGGYQPGRKYNGMVYLGGDPNDPTSWQH